MKHATPPRCPHAEVQFCPLYYAGHVPGYPSCDDGRLDEQTCGVARGLDYHALLGRLLLLDPRLVAQAEWDAALNRSRAQRDRNMRLSGVH